MYYVIYTTVSGQFRKDFPGFLSAFRFANKLEQASGVNTCLSYVFRHGRNVSCYQRPIPQITTPQTQMAWN